MNLKGYKVGISTSIILFFIIITLSLYIFNLLPLPSFLSSTENIDKKNENVTTEYTNLKTLVYPSSPKTFKNTSEKWTSVELPDKLTSKIKVSSTIRVNANLLINFEDDAPKNSSTGFFLDNGLKDSDPNLRKLSLFYFLEKKLWLLKYQTGSTLKYTALLPISPENGTVFGTFSLVISGDGKNIKVTLPNQSTKEIELPDSLYDVTNQMIFKTQTGPKSSITFSSLNYSSITE